MIIHWDCLEEMDKLIAEWIKVDAIITDPPYKVITWWKNWEKWKPSWILTKNKQLMNHIPEFKDWLPKCYNILKEQSHIYLMTNMLNLKDMMIETERAWFYIHNILIWKKNNATPNRWYMKNCEYIIFAKKWKSKLINNCWNRVVEEFNNPRNKLHPTEKPVELMEMYINNSSKEWELILDPFAWSWTTWVACKNTNRNYILIEKEKEYIDIINKRLWII
jgi:site-specific DNA-methyltransferase (adenine-specific)